MDIKNYAEDKEDLIAWEYLASKNIKVEDVEDVKYIDIGVNHPTITNNTYFFYTQGASGVLVEPLPHYYDLYAKERPRDTVIKGGVFWEDNKEGYVRRRGQHGGGSYVVTGYGKNGPGTPKWYTYHPCSFFRINDILKDNFKACPHYLSIDIESGDFEVMKDLDFQTYPIPVICAEFRKLDMKVINKFMFAKGYSVQSTKNNFIYTSK